MAGIKLPEIPNGKEFEEYIASYFQETGHYVEKNIIERHDEGEVLELDLVITDYYQNPPKMKLAELKTGTCKFSDIFKIRGWMYYLNFSNGIFITKKKSDNWDFFQKIGRDIDIDVIQIGELSKTNEALKEIIGQDNPDEDTIGIWRYIYWIERNLLERLRHQAKSSNNDDKRFKKLYDYQHKIDNEVFFNENIIQRLAGLYDTFYDVPNITAKCGNEMIGNDFNKEYNELPYSVFESTYYKCEDNLIQISTYLEHKNRLSILKNAVDYKLFKDAGVKKLTNDEIVDIKTLLGIKFEFKLSDSLPMQFKKNLDLLSEDPYFSRYPVFWQYFLWLFGGFILKDYKEEEYKLLSEKTKIPLDELPNAFASYGKLFPQKNGWFQDLPNSNIRIMKMFPIPFRGIAAHYRKSIYAKDQKWESLELTGTHTRKDLIKWNNLAYKVLKS